MSLFKKHWFKITLAYFVIIYLAVVVFAQQPFGTLALFYGLYLLALIAVFFGTFLGLLGLLIQIITRQEKIIKPFYKLAYRFKTENPTLLASYGILLLREDQNKLAKEVFERALAHTNHYLTEKTLKANIAITEWKLGHLQLALDMYMDIIKTYGKDDQAFIENPSYSDDMLDALVSENPSMYPQDYTTLGYLYILAKDYEKAMFFSKAALIKKEHFASAYDNIGQIYFQLDDLVAAKENFELALKHKPNLPDSLYFLGVIYEKSGEENKALSFYEKALAGHLDGLSTVSVKEITERASAIKHRHAFLS
jgi:Tfp pilus assembly protein PilF